MEIIAAGIGAAVLAGTFGGGYQAATIRIGFDDYSLLSYQGEFSFDSDVFELVDIRTQAAGMKSDLKKTRTATGTTYASRY